MSNLLIITLGTREVQFRRANLLEQGFILPETDKGLLKHNTFNNELFQIEKNHNFPEFVCCSEPRLAGKSILEHWKLFENLLELSLIQRAYNIIIKDNKIDHHVLVYTDQKDIDTSNLQQKRNYDRDTLYFAEIIRKKLSFVKDCDYVADLQDIAITTKTTDIDYLYRDFAIKCKYLFNAREEIKQIFLLAQGGIDQINHALTLQLIQAFGTKVKLWQQAEGVKPKELLFPHYFIRDFEHARLSELLNNYDFSGIYYLSSDPKIKQLSLIGYSLLSLDVDGTNKAVQDFLEKFLGDASDFNTILLNLKPQTSSKKQEIIYLGAKLNFRKGLMNEVIWRLHTLGEILLKPIVEDFIHCRIPEELPPFHKFNSIVKRVLPSPLILTLQQSVKGNNPMLIPSKAVFSKIYNFYTAKDPSLKRKEIERIRQIFKKIDPQRNNLVHHAIGMDYSAFRRFLTDHKLDWPYIEEQLDNYFAVPSGSLGIFDQIIDQMNRRQEQTRYPSI